MDAESASTIHGDVDSCCNEKNKNCEHFRYVLLSGNARCPVRATSGSAGYDVYSPGQFKIPPGHTLKVPLNIAISPPPGMYIRMASRSGLAVHKRIVCVADVIDPDYTGEIHMCLINLSNHTYMIAKHQRIGAIVFEQYSTPYPQEAQSLAQTQRADGSFGSTGKTRIY